MTTTIYQFKMDHLLKPTKQMIHLWKDLRASQILHWDKNISTNSIHIALLQGTHIFGGRQLAQELEKVYSFPTYAYDQHKNRIHWDGITDWLSDLSWIHSNTDDDLSVSKHYILCFYEPLVICKHDPTNFGIFIQVVCDAVMEHLKFNNSFHLILYPSDDNVTEIISKSAQLANICDGC